MIQYINGKRSFWVLICHHHCNLHWEITILKATCSLKSISRSTCVSLTNVFTRLLFVSHQFIGLFADNVFTKPERQRIVRTTKRTCWSQLSKILFVAVLPNAITKVFLLHVDSIFKHGTPLTVTSLGQVKSWFWNISFFHFNWGITVNRVVLELVSL